MARLSRWGAPRRRRSSKADAEALAFVITAVVALASAGIYLIVALVSAIASAKQRARTTRLAEEDSTQRSRFVAGETPAPPLPQPSEPDAFHAIHPVDPASFEYTTSIEAEATAVFGAWARRIKGAPKNPREVIKRIDINRELVGRLESTIEGRRFVWRTSAASKARLPSTPHAPIDKLDPWNPPPDLTAATLHGTTCR